MWEISLNYKAIAICAVLRAVIGAVWFSKFLFGRMSMPPACEGEAPKGSKPYVGIVVSTLASLLTAYVLALVIFAMGTVSVSEALQVGFLVWLGFTMVARLDSLLFGGMRFKLFLVLGAYNLIVLLAMSVLLTLWP